MKQNISRGIVLMNLGSPQSTQVRDVSRYLKEFLMDERVMDYSLLMRNLLVKGIIVPFRAPKSARAYQSIWTKEGSPLVVFTKQLQSALQKEVEEPVVIAMRYGPPSPEDAFNELLAKAPGLEEVILIPLYPHYAMSSYETAVEHAKQIFRHGKYPFRLTTIKPFFDDSRYIHALATNVRPFLQQEYHHLLFSYHGIPERHIKKSDLTGCHCLYSDNCCNEPSPAHPQCYRHQVFTTTRLVAEQLKIPHDKYSISFQSRLGKGWLQPFTDIRLERLPREGITKLLIVCPSFVSDCLETLEEIAERGKESFMLAGGESYTMVPCLNVHPLWIQAIAGWVKEYAGGNQKMILA